LPARLKNLTNEELKNVFGGNICCKEAGQECSYSSPFENCCSGLTCEMEGKSKKGICKKNS